MNIPSQTKWYATIAFLSLIATTVLNQYCAAQQASVATQNGVEVLTRGPVHEAFAETITFNPQPGMVGAESAAGRHRRSAASTKAGGKKRKLDSRLLGLG